MTRQRVSAASSWEGAISNGAVVRRASWSLVLPRRRRKAAPLPRSADEQLDALAELPRFVARGAVGDLHGMPVDLAEPLTGGGELAGGICDWNGGRAPADRIGVGLNDPEGNQLGVELFGEQAAVRERNVAGGLAVDGHADAGDHPRMMLVVGGSDRHGSVGVMQDRFDVVAGE